MSKTEPQEIKLFPSFNDSFTRYSLELMCPFSIFWILLLNYLLLMYCVGNVALCFLHRHLRAFVFFWTFTFQSLFSTTITFPTPLVFFFFFFLKKNSTSVPCKVLICVRIQWLCICELLRLLRGMLFNFIKFYVFFVIKNMYNWYSSGK